MPYVVAGLVLYLLWRYYAAQEQQASNGGGGNQVQPSGGLPHVNPVNPTNGGPSPAPTPTGGQWVQLTSPVVTPGYTYRASAPPQGTVVMMLLPGELASRGFVNVSINPPGTAFPADWPDSGNLLRIQGDLPASAQQGTLDFGGVTVWQWMPASAVAGAAARAAVHAVEAVRQHVGQVMSTHPHPRSTGVFAGLVRPPPRR